MSIGLYSLLTIDLFVQDFIESALKDNLGYFRQWVLISCLHDNFFTVELYCLYAPNPFENVMAAPAHPCPLHIL